MPKASIHLCEVNGSDVKEAPAFELPISDHDIIVGTNKHGTFATWNSLNPDSPVSPGFAPSGITGLRRLYHESEKQEHIRLVAQMIIDLFLNGVDALALQEIPAKSEPYFKPFMQHLEQLAQENQIELDFDAFNISYAQTKKTLKDGLDQGYHGFATGLLFRKGTFTLNGVTPLAGERGSSYYLTSNKSRENLTVLNTHGDYGQPDNVATEIVSALNNPNTIALGDTNIALTRQEAIAKMTNMKGVVVEPSSNIEGTATSSRTLDCFVTNIPSTYIFKNDCKNYATGVVET